MATFWAWLLVLWREANMHSQTRPTCLQFNPNDSAQWPIWVSLFISGHFFFKFWINFVRVGSIVVFSDYSGASFVHFLTPIFFRIIVHNPAQFQERKTFSPLTIELPFVWFLRSLNTSPSAGRENALRAPKGSAQCTSPVRSRCDGHTTCIGKPLMCDFTSQLRS